MPYEGTGKDGNLQFSFDLAKIDARIAGEPRIAQRASQALSAYFETGHTSFLAEPYVLGEPSTGTCSSPILMGLEMFAVGHEYAHLAADAGKLDPLPPIVASQDPNIDADAWA